MTWLLSLEELVEIAAANGLRDLSAAYGLEQRVRSLKLLAAAWQPQGVAATV